MQRLLGKLRNLAVNLTENHPFPTASRRSFFNGSSQLQGPASFTVSNSIFKPFLGAPTRTHPKMLDLGFQSSFGSLSLNQSRHFASKQKERKKGLVTPTVSKVKKTKMKFYSSYKSRFRVMNDGQIRRWREGKRHNAHLKSKISKRRLRLPALVHPAYATVMKKLNFKALT